jgi:hypothetical protein
MTREIAGIGRLRSPRGVRGYGDKVAKVSAVSVAIRDHPTLRHNSRVADRCRSCVHPRGVTTVRRDGPGEAGGRERALEAGGN